MPWRNGRRIEVCATRAALRNPQSLRQLLVWPMSNDGDPAVPVPAIVEALKVAGPRSATALARRLQLRKADVLVACRALATASHIRRLGKRWALRVPVRCAGFNKAGTQCGRIAAPGSAFCTHHEPRAHAPLPQAKAVGNKPAIAEPRAPRTAADGIASPTPPSAVASAHPDAPNDAPELFVRGHRVTEADVIDALSGLGDEEVQAFRDGRLPAAKAYRIAQNWLRTVGRMR
jgi:hypothetical protein